LLTILAVAVAVPLLAGCALWALQERMIFVNDPRRIEAPPGWSLERLQTEDGLTLAFLEAGGRPGMPVILYFHGNGGNAQDRANALSALVRRGHGVVIAGYRGYGGNPGEPGESAFAADAEAHWDHARARFPGRPLVLWGESLGTGVATRLAEGRAEVAALVLESPYTSIADIAQGMYPWLPTGLLLRHRFESLSRLPHVTAPVLVVASEQDAITPVDQARRMLAAARDGTGVFLPGPVHPAVLNDPTGVAMQRVLEFLNATIPAG